MATHMIQTTTRRSAVAQYPSAVKIIKVTGGYLAFDTWTDWQVWRRQR